jgi:hypothetical protein
VGYQSAAWHDFGVTVGGLAGALTGLLFVALSIKSDAIAQSRSLSSRAAQTLLAFVTPALAAVTMVAPQPAGALGGELIALAAACGAAMYVLDRRAGHHAEIRAARYVERIAPNLITPVLFAVAGITLLADAGGGLYWLVPGVVASLLGGVIGAWLFLLQGQPGGPGG